MHIRGFYEIVSHYSGAFAIGAGRPSAQQAEDFPAPFRLRNWLFAIISLFAVADALEPNIVKSYRRRFGIGIVLRFIPARKDFRHSRVGVIKTKF